MFEYECNHCGDELTGSFGDNVYCNKCNITYETDWDYSTPDVIGSWLTGVEHIGRIDIS